jgi:hypothetical protein
MLGLLNLTACVSGAPDLSDEQERRLPKLSVYPVGQPPSQPYSVLGTVTAADCSGAPLGGRLYGNVDRALDTLKRKAVAMDADAVIEVSCGAEPLLNNCRSAQKCVGSAVRFLDGAR